MRNFWARDLPVGEPTRGAPFGERCDPGAVTNSTPSTMGNVGAGMGVFGTLMNFIGNMKASSASSNAGDAQRAEADFEAAQMRQNAGQQMAASQRVAMTEALKTKLMVSRAAAVVAAGGGAVTDPGVAKIIGDVEGQGDFNRRNALYTGEDRARQMNLSADAKTYEGKIAQQGGQDRASAYAIKGFGGLATGGASLFGKYGGGGFKKAPYGTAGSEDATAGGTFDSGAW